MSRMAEFDDLTTISVTVTRASVAKCRKLGINKSEVCREALIIASGDEASISLYVKFKEVPKDFIKIMKRRVLENSETAGHWAKLAKKRFNIDVTKDEVIEYCYR